jgi:hypothetical protein
MTRPAPIIAGTLAALVLPFGVIVDIAFLIEMRRTTVGPETARPRAAAY